MECPTIARKPPAPPSPPDEPPPGPPPRATPPRRRAPAARLAAAAAGKLPATPGTPRKKAVAAGPARAARREPAERTRLETLQQVILSSLEDDKAEQIVTLDLAGRASFADRMVIATGLADRQISAMAAHLEEKLHAAGLKRIQVEGLPGADWVLIDAGDIVVHLFKPEARVMYALERMWGAELDDGPATAV